VSSFDGALTITEGSLVAGNQYGVITGGGVAGRVVQRTTLSGGARIESSLVHGIWLRSFASAAPNAPTLTLAPGTAVQGSGGHGVFIDGAASVATVHITGATLSANALSGLRTELRDSCRIRDTRVTGNVEFGIHLNASGGCDLGSGASPGGNTFTGNTGASVSVDGNGTFVTAVGNTWTASEQGADAQGRYVLPAGQTAPLEVAGPVTTGGNYRLFWYLTPQSAARISLAE